MIRRRADPGVGNPWVTTAGVTGMALLAGAVVPRLPRRVRSVANVVAAAAAVAVAVRGGLDAEDLGCDPSAVRAGARVGSVASLVAGAVVGATVGAPRTRELYADARVVEASPARAAYEMMVRIPFATALTEELLFRGAVLGAWQRAAGTPVAVAASSLAFGVWHVLPALESHTHNPAGAGLSARVGGRTTHVGATVVATAAAGVAFAALRLASRSVVAPIVAHAALNELGFLAARRAHARPRA